MLINGVGTWLHFGGLRGLPMMINGVYYHDYVYRERLLEGCHVHAITATFSP